MKKKVYLNGKKLRLEKSIISQLNSLSGKLKMLRGGIEPQTKAPPPTKSCTCTSNGFDGGC